MGDKMKNSGIEWIGEIPDSWHTLPLKRMVEKHFGGCWGEDAKNNDNDVLCIRIWKQWRKNCIKR